MRLFSVLWCLLAGQVVLAQSAYFQQQVDYQIEVALNDVDHELDGHIEVTYHNNSADTLELIYMHLWPNAYASDETPLAKQLLEAGETALYNAGPQQRGNIGNLDFNQNYKSISWTYDSASKEIAILQLATPLAPGKHTHITTNFKVDLPSASISRLGHIGQSYMITQWYPKPAVYDVNGWNTMPYLNQGEFYSEFGSFDVTIDVPSNYVVGGTGRLTTKSEVAFLDSMSKKAAKIAEYSHDLSYPKSSAKRKKLHYQIDQAHDFAWFADKRYHVKQRDLRLKVNQDSVRARILYTNNEADLWDVALDYVEDALNTYSELVGPYPYHDVTVVDGTISAGGGMEYPTITVIGESGDAFSLETVIMHEIGHNWFYGILGSNERWHPWMDEGLNTFIESRYVDRKYPKASILGLDNNGTMANLFNLNEKLHKYNYELTYLLTARKNLDQPIGEHAAHFSDLNYGAMVYSKAGLTFRHMMAYLGEDTTNEIFHAYFDRWQFKHPTPEDFRAVAEEVSGEDLSWIFDQLLAKSVDVDYAVGKLQKGAQTKLEIKNVGQVAAPVIIDIRIDKVGWTQIKTKGFADSRWIVLPEGTDSVIIDRDEEMLDVNRMNNTLALNKPFKRLEPVEFRLGGGLESSTKHRLFYLPIAGWNLDNGLMIGLAAYNNILPGSKKNWYVAPMYSINGQLPVGRMGARYTMDTKLGNLHLGTEIKSYFQFVGSTSDSRYYRYNPFVQLDFKKQSARSITDQRLTLESIWIQSANRNHSDAISTTLPAANYQRILYQLDHNHAINPSDAKAELIFGQGFGSASIEGKYKLALSDRKSIRLRGFAGTYLYNNTNDPFINWRMDGQRNGRDYLYQYYFLDRWGGNDFLKRQMTLTHGGFKVPTPLGQSNQWVAAINVESDLPIPMVGLFGDIGISGTTIGENAFTENALLYNAGLMVEVIPEIFSVYFPMLISTDIQSALGNETVKDRIRFTLHLERLNYFDRVADFDEF